MKWLKSGMVNIVSRRKKRKENELVDEGRIEEAKYNIRKVNKLHPEYTKETLEILDEYEKRSIN